MDGGLAAHEGEGLVRDALGERIVVELDIGQREGHSVVPSWIWSILRSLMKSSA